MMKIIYRKIIKWKDGGRRMKANKAEAEGKNNGKRAEGT
jgi:hypothetical protein